ncbi:hypothetical protein ACHAWF_009050 [Thalassiosira exigua]
MPSEIAPPASVAPEVGISPSTSTEAEKSTTLSYEEFEKFIGAPSSKKPDLEVKMVEEGGKGDDGEGAGGDDFQDNALDDEKKDAKGDVEAVVAVAEPAGADVAAKPSFQTAAPSSDSESGSSSSHVRQRTDYPPSFFTNDRGNLKAVSFVVRRPCLIFWLLIALLFAVMFLLQAAVFRDGNPFTIPSNEFDLDDVRSVQYDSLRLARDEASQAREAAESEASDASAVVSRQSETAAIAFWVFEAEADAGVFGSEESIRGMKDAYDIFYSDPAFEDWCLLDYRAAPAGSNATRGCSAPLTPLTMYYASEWDSDAAADVVEELQDPAKVEIFNELAPCVLRGLYCELANATKVAEHKLWVAGLGAKIYAMASKWDMKGELVENFTQVTELASHLIAIDIFKGFVDFGMDKGFSAENPVSMYSRGIVTWGGPLEDRNKTANEEDSEKEEDSDDDERKAFIKEHYLEDMNTQAEGSRHASINSYYFMTTIIGEVILDIVSKDAMLAIFSFAFIFFWLRVNTASWFLALIGLVEIFFSIPVAWFLFTVVFRIKYFATLNALALFVVAAIGADDIFIFMDAYKQSRYHPEVLVDLETRMSWVYRRTGTAMGITSATTCAAFLCTLITPLPSIQSFGIFAAVVIFIDYVLVMSLFCTSVVIYHNRYESNACFGCCCPCGPVRPSNTEQALTALQGSEGAVKRDKVSEFFRTKVAGFVKVPLHRAVLGVLFAIWVGVAIWQATMLEATKESEQFLNENHPLQKSFSILGKEFPTADDDLGLKVYYAWGVEEVDRTGVNRLTNPEFYGSPRFMSGFDFNEQCQTDLMAFCDKLKSDMQYNELIKRKNGIGQVHCFIEELAAYNVKGCLDTCDGEDNCDYVLKQEWKNANVTWQVDPNDIPAIMPEFLKQKTCYDEQRTESISGRYQNELGWDGSALRYAAISAESSILSPFTRDSELRTRTEYEQFIDIAKEQDKIISQSCGGTVVMTDLREKFVFMNNQSIYVQSAIQSACLGVAIAFAVLLVSTRVFHIAFFASISIMCVLVSVVGVMVMLGWNLGSIESILIGIIAGFSVDYVVHLAHAYEIARGDTYTRITEAFSDLGISVFNGMITSVVASIPLFFCQLQFFAKFGTFLCLTIAFSWIFANFGFMSLLAQLKIPLKENGCRL